MILTNKILLRRSLLLGICVLWLSLPNGKAEDLGNPKPLPDDLVLPMPGEQHMVFRPIWLDVGDGPFALREMLMGSRAGEGFRENPTKVQLGGSFLQDNGGKKDWLFYLAKYEVTEAQFAAVVPAAINPTSAGFPKTNVSLKEVQDFLDTYNAWLFQNARAALPMLDGVPAFVRLPTEPEWEFAARGGSAVDTNRFDQRTPYPGDLAKFEWFGGPRSSHGKLKGVGLLEANPLGLHDMLGNCAEIASNLYQVEYVQGRAGGLICRGGDFRTDEAVLRSSQRTEFPLYTRELKPARSDSIGFRVVLATPVFTSIVSSRAMEAAWREYAQKRSAPMSPSLTTATVNEQTAVGMDDTEKLLQDLQTELGRHGALSETARTKIILLRSSFQDVRANVRRAETKFAEAGVHLTSLAAIQIANSHRKIAIFRSAYPAGSQPDSEDQAEIAKEEKNLTDARSSYIQGLQLLGQVNVALAARTFDAWIAELRTRQIPQHSAATAIAKRHFDEFARSKRLDVDRWSKELAGIYDPPPTPESRP